MPFGWLNASAASDFGISLADFYMTRVPTDMAASDKKFASHSKEVLDKMALQVARFKQTHPLNVYKKAKLGNAFKWKLRDAGYDSAYIDRLTEWLVAKLESQSQ
jgi:hypothetical protein